MAEIGLSDFYYAECTSDTASELIYKAPTKIPGLMSLNINPNTVESTLYADDGPAETSSSISKIDVEIQLKDLPLADQAILLGSTIENGVIRKKTGDVPPYIAIGFKTLKSNGKYRYVWLKKGKFSESQNSHTTKGEQIQYNTPTVRASFVATVYDSEWLVKADEDATGFAEATATNWFTTVTLEDGLAATAEYTEGT